MMYRGNIPSGDPIVIAVFTRNTCKYFIIICCDNRPPQFLSMWVQVTIDVITLDTVIISSCGNTEMVY